MDSRRSGTFRFLKPIKNSEGVIPQGTELYLVEGVWYMNGGLVPGDYQLMFDDILRENEKLPQGRRYLVEERMV